MVFVRQEVRQNHLAGYSQLLEFVNHIVMGFFLSFREKLSLVACCQQNPSVLSSFHHTVLLLNCPRRRMKLGLLFKFQYGWQKQLYLDYYGPPVTTGMNDA